LNYGETIPQSQPQILHGKRFYYLVVNYTPMVSTMRAVKIASKIIPMPWPATHILIAEKVFDTFFSHLEKKAFIIGTCFPDIRYPARIEREQTHLKNLSLKVIQAKPAFQAGLSFHSMVDGVWNGYVQLHSETLFSVAPHNRAMLHVLKILQDQYLYPFYDRWDQVTTYFGNVLPEERSFEIDEEMLQKWHEMLVYYLQKPPSKADLQMLSISLPGDLINKINHYYQIYENHPTIQHIMTEFYTDFESLLSENERGDTDR